jgi:Fic family protein
MQRQDFTKEAPGERGRIIRPRSVNDYSETADDYYIDAFSPHPLPPKLTYDAEMVDLVGRASIMLGRLDEKLSELPNPNVVVRPLLRHEALESSRIEGTIADLDEIALFQADPQAPQKNPDSIREVNNYVNALSWGIAQMDYRTVTTEFIKELHHYLLEGVTTYRYERGVLREMQAIIGSPGRSIDQARFIPPPHEVSGRLLDLERFIAGPNDIPPLIRLALTHYQFETIHPFPDGNGRVGRMMIPMLLRSWGIMQFPHVDFSAYVAPRRDEYMDLLLRVSQKGDWRPWLKFFLEALERQGKVTLGQARNLLADRDRMIGLFRDGLRMRHPNVVADHLIEHASITTKQLQNLNHVTATTAQKMIDEMTKRDLVVEATGRQRDRVYVARGVQLIFTSDRD